MDKILIADDNAFIRRLIRGILINRGYELIEARDGEEAIKACLNELPDLILLDVEMPKKNGYEACKIIKKDHRTKDIPIVFLSGRAGASDKIRGLELGASDYIAKPFDKGEVIARVRAQLEIRRLTKSLIVANKQLTERQKTLDEDLKAAAQIQKSLIPKAPPAADGFDFAWRFMPCERIGGDLFNIHRLDESHLAIYVVDVCGHGVPSAMVTVSVSQTMLPGSGTIMTREENSEENRIVNPTEVLNILDREYPMDRFDKFFTISYIILNTDNGLIRYSSAAHPMPVLVRARGEIELLDRGGTVIGMGDMMPFRGGEKKMRRGDRLIIYTDGVVEYENPAGEFYGEERFYHELVKHRKDPLNTYCKRIIDSVTAFGGGCGMHDDITLLALERLSC